MLLYIISISILCSVSGFNFKRPDPKCDVTDSKCIAQNIFNDLIQSSVPGIEELGVVPIDPVHLQFIEKRLPNSELSLIDSTATGVKDAIINEIKDIENEATSQTTTRFEITLPHFEITGTYKFNGKINDLAIGGDGKYYYNASNINTVAEVLEELYEKDGKKYVKFSNLQAKLNLVESVNVTHYNSGTKSMPEEVLKFLHENPKFLSDLLQDSINLAILDKLFDDFNKILATVSVDELFTGDLS